MVTCDVNLQEHVVRETLRLAADIPFDLPPPWMGKRIHRLLRETVRDPDPYRDVKRDSTRLAQALYPDLKRRVRTSTDRFAIALRLAIAGNIIDFGCRTHIRDSEIYQSIEDTLKEPLDEAAIETLRHRIAEAHDILYLADNAGEIVFDRLLIEELPTARTTVVVRGGPVINDATREDAVAAGLTARVRVIDNGSDVPGTILESCSSTFQARFARSDLIIAKGQGNYETLNDQDADIFFLLKAKCPVIARHIGCDAGSSVVCRSRPSRSPADRPLAEARMADRRVPRGSTPS
jgi:uncharacterized protein with ATP-grasp and redox domains